MNFDYGSVFYMVQTTLPASVSQSRIASAVAAERAVSNGDGFGHPGITTDRAFLQQLDRASCSAIEDDVIRTPYFDEWRSCGGDASPWFPVLREDGFVGVFRDDSDAATVLEHASGTAKYYIIVCNALPYFACDQLRVLIETNTKNWTWEQWKTSAEVKRATELPTVVAKTVCDRMLAALDALVMDVEERSPLKQTKRPLVTVFNVFNPDPLKIDSSTISYDAGVARSSCWSKEGTLTRVIDAGAMHFVWIKNLKCENGNWTTRIDRCKHDVLIPAEAEDTVVDKICNRLANMPEFAMQRVDLVSL
jgi:hypothetical protein